MQTKQKIHPRTPTMAERIKKLPRRLRPRMFRAIAMRLAVKFPMQAAVLTGMRRARACVQSAVLICLSLLGFVGLSGEKFFKLGKARGLVGKTECARVDHFTRCFDKGAIGKAGKC